MQMLLLAGQDHGCVSLLPLFLLHVCCPIVNAVTREMPCEFGYMYKEKKPGVAPFYEAA